MRSLYIFFISALVWSCSGEPPSSAATASEPAVSLEQAYRVAVLGDSVSAGINADVDTSRVSFGWVDLWTARSPAAVEGLPPDFNANGILGGDAYVRNFAKPGWRITNWLAPAAFQPVVDYRPDLLIVFIGGNDLLEYIRNGDFTVDELELLEEKLTRLFDAIQESMPESKVLVIGYYDLFDGLSSRLPEATAMYRGLSEWGKQSNALLQAQAQARGFFYLDLSPAFMGHGYGRDLGGEVMDPPYVRLSLRSFDIHPGTHGHRAIAEAVSQFLLMNPPRAAE